MLFVIVLAGLLVPIDTHRPLIVIPVIGAPSVLATFIMRRFFLTLPGELEDWLLARRKISDPSKIAY